MICEYVMMMGQKLPLDLSSCCKRHGISTKIDVTTEYLSKGIGFDQMPWEVVEEYGKNDIHITTQLFLKQVELFGIESFEDLYRMYKNDPTKCNEEGTS